MERGLVPYPLREEADDMAEIVGTTHGIFVWTRRQTGLDHFGVAAANSMKHLAGNVAVLQAEWPDADTAETDRPLVHDGHVSGMVYHQGEPFVIVMRTIPPERIRVAEIVSGPAALGYLMGATGVLADWQNERMARGLPPGPVLDAASHGSPRPKVRRNAPCPCGSGRKAKRCCAS